MGGWNTDSGASLHAELVGRNWKKDGHKVRVFTFYDYAFHGTNITGKDEPWVDRCFTVSSYKPQKFDPLPFLTTDYEVFVVEDLGMLPKDLLGKFFWRIKKRAVTVNVIHDGDLSRDPSFYQFDWDAVVCFDERYRKFLVRLYDPEKLHIIPYPCYPLKPGDKKEKRQKLGLPLDKKIIYCFGPAANSVPELASEMEKLKKEYPLMLLCTTKNEEGLKKFTGLKNSGSIPVELRAEAPEIDRLYDYLIASDLLLFNKPSIYPPRVVISSTVFQCMGSLCPIVAKESNYIDNLNNEVLKYSNLEELKERVVSVFEEDKQYRSTVEAARKYVENNSSEQVARKFVSLFETLIRKK
jgi:glycosyltransferase involved in cell wall biosynthesis